MSTASTLMVFRLTLCPSRCPELDGQRDTSEHDALAHTEPMQVSAHTLPSPPPS